MWVNEVLASGTDLDEKLDLIEEGHVRGAILKGHELSAPDYLTQVLLPVGGRAFRLPYCGTIRAG